MTRHICYEHDTNFSLLIITIKIMVQAGTCILSFVFALEVVSFLSIFDGVSFYESLSVSNKKDSNA